MPSEPKKTPSVLMLLLSALGILFSLAIAAGAILVGTQALSSESDALTLISAGALALLIGLLLVPSLVFSIRKLRGRASSVNNASLFKSASLALIGWAGLLVAGFFLSKDQGYPFLLAPITILCTVLPIWWLIEFFRRGIQRPSHLKETAALTVGLTVAPTIIILVEVLLVLMIALVVVFLLGMQSGALSSIVNLAGSLSPSQSGIESIDQLLLALAGNPTIAAALFIVIGVVAPFTEELFKPLAVWLVRRDSLVPYEGFELGLISGGAFTLLESASLVSQTGSQDWITVILMRTATSALHIGLSGLVGYGVARARCEKRWGNALLNILAATALHGSWNSLAMVNGYLTTPLTSIGAGASLAGGVITVVCMVLVFAAVVSINLRLSARLRQARISTEEISIGVP
jgi:hypothetical protein